MWFAGTHCLDDGARLQCSQRYFGSIPDAILTCLHARSFSSKCLERDSTTRAVGLLPFGSEKISQEPTSRARLQNESAFCYALAAAGSQSMTLDPRRRSCKCSASGQAQWSSLQRTEWTLHGIGMCNQIQAGTICKPRNSVQQSYYTHDPDDPESEQ